MFSKSLRQNFVDQKVLEHPFRSDWNQGFLTKNFASTFDKISRRIDERSQAIRVEYQLFLKFLKRQTLHTSELNLMV